MLWQSATVVALASWVVSVWDATHCSIYAAMHIMFRSDGIMYALQAHEARHKSWTNAERLGSGARISSTRDLDRTLTCRRLKQTDDDYQRPSTGIAER